MAGHYYPSSAETRLAVEGWHSARDITVLYHLQRLWRSAAVQMQGEPISSLQGAINIKTSGFKLSPKYFGIWESWEL